VADRILIAPTNEYRSIMEYLFRKAFESALGGED
jgi:hypothetical protein